MAKEDDFILLQASQLYEESVSKRLNDNVDDPVSKELRLKEKYPHLEVGDFLLDKPMEDIPTTEIFDKPVSESDTLEKIVRTRRMHHQNQKKPSWKMMGHQATNLFKH